MMRVDSKRLNETDRVWLDRAGDPINIDRAWQASDKRIALTRREQAMLAAAGMDGPEARWYVLCIAAHAEKDVDKSLGDAGVERWFPVEKRLRKAPHAKRQVVYHVPALPGYVFVRVVNCAQTWAALMSIDGVKAVLGGAVGPVPVTDAMRLKLKQKLEERSTDAEVVEAAFPVGANVLIEEGPFASYHGVIESVLDEQVATVLVAIFGRFTPVQLSLAQITKSE